VAYFKKNIGSLRKALSFIYSPFGTFLVALISLLVYLIVMLSAGTSDLNRLTKVYFAGDISYAHQLIIDRFNELYKNKIEIVAIDLAFKEFTTNDRKELLARALRSKSDKVDLFSVDQIWVQRFAKWAEPLDKYINNQKRESILKDAVSSCYSNGRLVAVPINIDVGVMYYRKDLIGQLKNSKEIKKQLENSLSWHDFISLGENFRDTSSPYYIFPADNYEGLVCSFIELVLNQNKNFFNTPKINLLKPESVRSLQLLKDLIYKYKLSPESVTEFDEGGSFNYYVKNNGIFLRGWPSYKKDKKNLLVSEAKDTLLTVSPLPHFEGYEPSPILGGWNLMLSNTSKKKEAALKFIQFIDSKEAQEILFEEGGYLPILREFYTSERYKKLFPKLQFFYHQIKQGVHRPYIADYTRISDIMAYYIHRVLLDKISVEQALKEATILIDSNKILIE
jgi:multiple sugar transport system substrate-binding protein